MQYHALTDIGFMREKNQDAYLTALNEYGDLLMLVADGIGGGKAGEVASAETASYFERVFAESGPFSQLEDVAGFLSYHIGHINKLILDMSHHNLAYEGMGTTLTGVLVTSLGDTVFNCGDSRVYGIFEGKLVPLTKDDTYINQMIEEGRITQEEAIDHPKKHYLVKAIGIFEESQADIHPIEAMERYLVCSDGLHSYVSDEEMTDIIMNDELTIKEKTIALKELALRKGGYDNITVILYQR